MHTCTLASIRSACESATLNARAAVRLWTQIRLQLWRLARMCQLSESLS